jgi:anti-sigma B factor antagonist
VDRDATDYYHSETELVGDAVVLAVTGETDLHTAPRFERDLDQAMRMAAGDLILDISGLEFVDSIALGLMMDAHRRMREQRRSLVLVVDRPCVLRVFTITGLDTLFSVLPTRDKAIAKVEATRWARQVA